MIFSFLPWHKAEGGAGKERTSYQRYEKIQRKIQGLLHGLKNMRNSLMIYKNRLKEKWASLDISSLFQKDFFKKRWGSLIGYKDRFVDLVGKLKPVDSGIPLKKMAWISLSVLVFGGVIALSVSLSNRVNATEKVDPAAEAAALARAEAEEEKVKAYTVSLAGSEIGFVEDQDDVVSILNEIREEYSNIYRVNVVDFDVAFQETTVPRDRLSPPDELEKLIRKNISVKVEAAVLKINGQALAALRTEDEVEDLLERIKQPYLAAAQEAGNTVEEIDFLEEVAVETAVVDLGEIKSVEQALFDLTMAQEEQSTYTVKAGDDLWTIAKRHQISLEEIQKINPQIKNFDLIHPGDVLYVKVLQKPINVVTVEIVEYREAIPFKTQTREDGSLYKGQSKTIQNGSAGEKKIKAKVYKQNGLESSKEILSEEVIKEPVPKIVAKGTKEYAKYSKVTPTGNGTMIWPTEGIITSQMGSRWGSYHEGIDIGNSSGTPVYAAKSGTVIFADWAGGYGKLVKVDHGGGLVTFYGHLKSWVVKSGQKVKQGQLIGYMGNTGRSTGPHLHFEVRLNGKAVNPLKYLQ